MLHLAQEKRGAAEAEQRICAVVRHLLAGCHMAERNLLRPPAIGCDKSGSNPSPRQDPVEIFGLHMRRADPESLLIDDQMLEKWRKQTILRIFSGLQLISLGRTAGLSCRSAVRCFGTFGSTRGRRRRRRWSARLGPRERTEPQSPQRTLPGRALEPGKNQAATKPRSSEPLPPRARRLRGFGPSA